MSLHQELSDSDVEEKNRTNWSDWLDKYTERLKKEEEDISDTEALGKDRVDMMNNTNPR